MKNTVIVVILALWSVACASVQPEIEDEQERVLQEIQERTGAHVPSIPASRDAEIDEKVRSLLAVALDEDTAIRIALLNNRDVMGALERVGVARSDVIQAGLLANPVVDAKAKFFSSGTEIELGLVHSLLDFFFRPLRVKVSEHQLEEAKAMVSDAIVALTFDIRRAFVHLRAARMLVESQQDSLDAASASRELMEKLHAAGNVTDPQLTIERLVESRARLDLSDAEQVLQEAREPINVLLGLWGDSTRWNVDGQLPEDARANLDDSRIESRCIESNLALIAKRAQIDAAAQQADLTSWDSWLSSFRAGIASTRELDDEWGLGPSLEFEVPFFDRGQGKEARAYAMLREALNHHYQLAVEVRATARTLRKRLQALDRRASFMRAEHLPNQARLLRETLQSYNAMQIGAFEVLQRRQQEVSAAREYIDTMREAWLARFDLEQLLAGSIPRGALDSFWPEAKTNEPMGQVGDH